jgi:hypothetical protein
MYNNQELILFCPGCKRFHLFKIKEFYYVNGKRECEKNINCTESCSFYTNCDDKKYLMLNGNRTILLRENIDTVNSNHEHYSIYDYVTMVSVDIALYSTDYYLVECKSNMVNIIQ